MTRGEGQAQSRELYFPDLTLPHSFQSPSSLFYLRPGFPSPLWPPPSPIPASVLPPRLAFSAPTMAGLTASSFSPLPPPSCSGQVNRLVRFLSKASFSSSGLRSLGLHLPGPIILMSCDFSPLIHYLCFTGSSGRQGTCSQPDPQSDAQ